MKHKFRASSLGLIMGDAKSIDPSLLTEELAAISRKTKKTDEDKALLEPLWDRSLSAGAKTYIESLAKQEIYAYEEVFTSKYTEKGTMVEDESIALYNEVFFTKHSKNPERKTNEWITGECDIVTPEKIIDIKSCWSLPTFPATAAAGADSGYEWQVRAYLWLWNRELAEVAYCIVNTPPELIGYENELIHYVDHINPELRVTLVHYTRDKVLEDKMKARVEAANDYLQLMIQKIADEHNF